MIRIKKFYLLSSKHTQTSLLDITFLGSVVVPIYAIKTSPIMFVKGTCIAQWVILKKNILILGSKLWLHTSVRERGVGRSGKNIWNGNIEYCEFEEQKGDKWSALVLGEEPIRLTEIQIVKLSGIQYFFLPQIQQQNIENLQDFVSTNLQLKQA